MVYFHATKIGFAHDQTAVAYAFAQLPGFLFFDVITSLVSMEHGVYGCEKVTSLGEVTSNGLA
jgi:hypothetical protein